MADDALAPPQADFVGRAAAAGVVVSDQQSWGDLEVDIGRYEVRRAGAVLSLTPRQTELLALFLAAPQRIWTRSQLHQICWGDGTSGRGVDVQLCRIRARIGADLFRNVPDRGWLLRSA